MSTVQLQAGEPPAIGSSPSQEENSLRLWRKTVGMLVGKLHRLWWQAKAYVTILSMMLLILVSLFFVYGYWLYRKFLPVLAKRVIKNSG